MFLKIDVQISISVSTNIAGEKNIKTIFGGKDLFLRLHNCYMKRKHNWNLRKL